MIFVRTDKAESRGWLAQQKPRQLHREGRLRDFSRSCAVANMLL